MAYSFTCYGYGENSDGIASITIKLAFTGVEYTVNNGEEMTLGGFTSEMSFDANVKSGYKFSRWVYRVGSTTATQQFSYTQTFVYSGGQDIYIRAEAVVDENDETEWTAESEFIGMNVSTFTLKNVPVKPNTLWYGAISFAGSGDLLVYASAPIGLIGYLCTDFEYTESGEPSPSTIVLMRGSANGDLSMPCSVTAGKQYYIVVRGYEGTESKNINLYIEPPTAPTWELWSAVSEDMDEDESYYLSLSEYEIYRRAVTFLYSGEVSIYSDGDDNVCCWFGRSSGYDESDGIPNQWDYKDDNGKGDGINFKITCNVVAGQQYYIWVRANAITECETYLYIIPPKDESQKPKRWSWDSSNGEASATQTDNAYQAVMNKLETSNFSYKVWNDMVQKVHDIIWASGRKYWDATYSTEEDTKFTSSNEVLTAVMFNSLRNNLDLAGLSAHIGLGYQTGIGAVAPKDKVYGQYFITLTDYMNECIDKL